MLSYPNGHPKDKVVHCANVVEMGAMFEELGVDFRIVLLDRSPESILVSTLINRPQGYSIAAHSQLYVFTHQIIQTQLKKLDPNFLVASFSVENSFEENRRTLASLKEFLGFSDADINTLLSSARKQMPRCIQASQEANYEKNLLKFVKLYRIAYALRKLVRKLSKRF